MNLAWKSSVEQMQDAHVGVLAWGEIPHLYEQTYIAESLLVLLVAFRVPLMFRVPSNSPFTEFGKV